MIDSHMPQMIAPPSQCLSLVLESADPLALNFRLVEVGLAVIGKERFPANRWECALRSLVPLDLERLLRRAQAADGFILGINQRETPRPFLSIAQIQPELAIVSAVAQVQTANPPIAGIARGGKVGPAMRNFGTMRIGGCLGAVGTVERITLPYI